MKKIKLALNNIYNVLIIRKNQSTSYKILDTDCPAEFDNMDEEFKRILNGDKLDFEVNPEIQHKLREAVRLNQVSSKVHKSSFEDMFLSLFSFRYFELKMAAVGIIFICYFGGSNFENSYRKNTNQNTNGKLCDTFPKSSPTRVDSVLR